MNKITRKLLTISLSLIMLICYVPKVVEARDAELSNLRWGGGVDDRYPAYANWDYNGDASTEFIVRLCNNNGEPIDEEPFVKTKNKSINIEELVAKYGTNGGDFKFSVTVSGDESSTKVSEAKTFYTVIAEWTTQKEDGTDAADKNDGYGELFLNNADTGSGHQASYQYFLVGKPNEGIEVTISAQIGYVVQSVTLDSESTSGNMITFTLNKSHKINVVFKKDDSVAGVYVNFGSTHKDVAQTVKGYYDNNKDSYDNISNVQVDDNGVMAFNYFKENATEDDVWDDVTDLIEETYSDVVKDNGEYICVGSSYIVGKSTIDKYDSYDEWYDEYQDAENTSLGEQLQLNVLWFVPASVGEFEVKPLLCNTQVTIQKPDGYRYYVQSPSVEATDTKDSEVVVALDSFNGVVPAWFKEKPEDYDDIISTFYEGTKLYKGTATIEDNIYALIPIYPKIGYVLVDDNELNVKINGKELSSDEIVLSEKNYLIKTIPVEHNWSSWRTIKYPTQNEEGLEERVCLNDPSHKQTRSIPVKPYIIPKTGIE